MTKIEVEDKKHTKLLWVKKQNLVRKHHKGSILVPYL